MTSYLDNMKRGVAGNGTANASPHPTAPGDCSSCHKHDSGFKPSGCNGCHGNSAERPVLARRRRRQVPAYADDNAGAHQNHVQAISRRVFGQTIAQLLADADTTRSRSRSAGTVTRIPAAGATMPTAAATRGSTSWVPAPSGGSRSAPSRYRRPPRQRTPAVRPTPPAPSPRAPATISSATTRPRRPSGTPLTGLDHPRPPDELLEHDLPRRGDLRHHRVTRHARQFGAASRQNYACTQCHVEQLQRRRSPRQPPAPERLGRNERHRNAGGRPKGGHDRGARASATASTTRTGVAAACLGGDTGFAYKNGRATPPRAYQIYCHGDDNAAAVPGLGRRHTTPVWNNPGRADLLLRPPATTATAPGDQAGWHGTRSLPAATRAPDAVDEPAFVETANPLGPRSRIPSSRTYCSACHTSQSSYLPQHDGVPTVTHADGTVDFTGAISGHPWSLDLAATMPATSATGRHGGSDGEGQLGQWRLPAPLLGTATAREPPPTAPRHRRPAASVAPAKSANWTTPGHGSWPRHLHPSGRTGAARPAPSCHNVASVHINGALGTPTGSRPPATAVQRLPRRDRRRASATTQVSTHGNRRPR